jgi:hypothetical protein
MSFSILICVFSSSVMRQKKIDREVYTERSERAVLLKKP